MKSERYEILSLANTGQIPQEEAELRLALLGKRERRAFRLILSAVVLLALATLVIVFHLEDKIFSIAYSALQSIENSAIFRETYILLRRVKDAL